MIPIQYPDMLIREDGSTVMCRFYPGNRGNGITKKVDGTEVDVSFTIALPLGAPQLLTGETVTGYDQNGEVIVWKIEVALFHRGQFHCVAYV